MRAEGQKHRAPDTHTNIHIKKSKHATTSRIHNTKAHLFPSELAGGFQARRLPVLAASPGSHGREEREEKHKSDAPWPWLFANSPKLMNLGDKDKNSRNNSTNMLPNAAMIYVPGPKSTEFIRRYSASLLYCSKSTETHAAHLRQHPVSRHTDDRANRQRPVVHSTQQQQHALVGRALKVVGSRVQRGSGFAHR